MMFRGPPPKSAEEKLQESTASAYATIAGAISKVLPDSANGLKTFQFAQQLRKDPDMMEDLWEQVKEKMTSVEENHKKYIAYQNEIKQLEHDMSNVKNNLQSHLNAVYDIINAKPSDE
jgi:uncharacterized protein YabN with tetrapyrrole methylase and pyrophosphatase domain